MGSPFVVVRKQDGELRSCADYKIGVNQKICLGSYLIPNIENVFYKMADICVVVSVIDICVGKNVEELKPNLSKILNKMKVSEMIINKRKLVLETKTHF